MKILAIFSSVLISVHVETIALASNYTFKSLFLSLPASAKSIEFWSLYTIRLYSYNSDLEEGFRLLFSRATKFG